MSDGCTGAVVVTNWSGTAELVNERNGYPIAVEATEEVPLGTEELPAGINDGTADSASASTRVMRVAQAGTGGLDRPWRTSAAPCGTW
jgi:hypothetical protein